MSPFRLTLRTIPGEAFKAGSCMCGSPLRVSSKAGVTECHRCGAAYQNLTGWLATAWLLAELGHEEKAPP